jgi:hypothetical protein
MRSSLRLARLTCAGLLVVASLSHARLASAGGAHVHRHELFVGLNLALATLLALRPRWALVPAMLLSVQQLWSHGTDLVGSLRGPGPLDWASAGVVVFFPALVTLLVVERRTAGTPERPPGARPG